MKLALVVSFNAKTEEILFTRFDGDGAANQAEGWAHKTSFIHRDFPAKDGWVHFAWWNKEAGRERGEAFVRGLTSGEGFKIQIPQ